VRGGPGGQNGWCRQGVVRRRCAQR
jgi:hypothetical protein